MDQKELFEAWDEGVARGDRYMLLLRSIDDGVEFVAYLNRNTGTPSQAQKYWLRNGARMVKSWDLNKPWRD